MLIQVMLCFLGKVKGISRGIAVVLFSSVFSNQFSLWFSTRSLISDTSGQLGTRDPKRLGRTPDPQSLARVFRTPTNGGPHHSGAQDDVTFGSPLFVGHSLQTPMETIWNIIWMIQLLILTKRYELVSSALYKNFYSTASRNFRA